MPKLLTHRNKIIKNAYKFLADNPNVFNNIYKILGYNDEPKLYGYTIRFNDVYGENKEDSVATGISFDRENALLKVLGETIERYCLSTNNQKKLVYKSFNELIKLNEPVINPESFVLYPDDKKYIIDLSRKRLHWIKGKFLVSNQPVFVPAQTIYVPYVYYGMEPLLRFDNSTGAAAGVTLDDAIYRGICEVIERDSFMIAYLNKIASPKIDLSSIEDKSVHNLLSMLKRYRLEVVVLDATTDLKVPSFVAIIIDRTGIGPAISVGLKAGFNIKETIMGAIEESLMVRSWTRDNFSYVDSMSEKSKSVNSSREKTSFWYSVHNISHLNFWLNNKSFVRIDKAYSNLQDSNLERVLALLYDKDIEIIYVDITDNVVRKYGFVVIKVIIPKLQYIYLDEENSYVKEKRLYDAPVKMGVINRPNTESALNKIPHPFL